MQGKQSLNTSTSKLVIGLNLPLDSKLTIELKITHWTHNDHWTQKLSLNSKLITMNQVLLKREAITIFPSKDRTQIVHLPCNCPFFLETLRSLTSETRFATSVLSNKSSYNFSPSTTFTIKNFMSSV